MRVVTVASCHSAKVAAATERAQLPPALMKNTLSYQAYRTSRYRSVKHTTYFGVYDDLFLPYRDREITFVEIGVLGGGSLFMWREFFGPKARIIGIDLNPNAKKWASHGFEIYIGSQSDERFWAEFKRQVGAVDIVLDDGGHTYEQQIISTEALLGSIKDGGMLVVEDTHTSYMDGFGPRGYSFVEYTKCMMDKINRRFGNLEQAETDRRVWSIRIYESFVAFLVNSPATSLKSEQTDNGGIDDFAVDFRHREITATSRMRSLLGKFAGLRQIPGFEWLKKHVLAILVNKRFTARRYFQ